MKPAKDKVIRDLRLELKDANERAEEFRRDYYKQKDIALEYRKCVTEILIALGEHGSSLSHDWLGRKLGGLLK